MMIIVTDSEMRQALACIRSLGRKGLKVVAGDCRKISIGFFSKYAYKKIVYPDPEENENKYIEVLYEFVKNNDVDLIIPIRDKCLIPLAKQKDIFEKHTHIICPNYKTVMVARDKAKTISIANEVGVPVPKTLIAKEKSDLKKTNQFPVLMKPAESSGSRGMRRCYSYGQLERSYMKLRERYKKFLIQDLIPSDGEEVGFYCMYNRGKLETFTMHKRLRSYPPEGGPSTLRITVYDKEVHQYSKILLDVLKWHGPAMVQFKKDIRDNMYKLMEINPRFWGSLSLDILAGVDYPYYLYQMAKGEEITQNNYERGVVSRWLLPGDLLWLTSNPKKNLINFIKTKADQYDVISKDDIMPIFGFILSSITYFFSLKKLRYVFKR